MSWFNILRTAFRAVTANKLRSALTALGVMIGVASVITMLALGNGARIAVDQSFRFLGSDQVQISAKMDFDQGDFLPVGKNLTYEEGLHLKDATSLVSRVAMSVNHSGKARHGRNVLDMTISGSTADALDFISLNEGVQPVDWKQGNALTVEDFIAQGRFYTPAEVMQNAEVCVLGYDTVQDLFPGEDPIGQTVWVDRKPFEVIGVLVELETVDPTQRQYSKPNELLSMPVGTAIETLYTGDDLPTLFLTAYISDATRVDEAKAQISTYLRQQHAIMPDAEGIYEDDFSLTTKQDLLGAQMESARTFSLLLTAMAIVSLGVGGIGIMNVMLVSVTERTREIGVRLAVGARRRDIIAQFLTESLLMSAASGVIGIALGMFAIPISAVLNQGNAVLDPQSIPLSFGIALTTGVIFGLYPALRAARLNPIMALRYE